MQAIKLLIFFFLRHCLGSQNAIPPEGETKNSDLSDFTIES